MPLALWAVVVGLLCAGTAFTELAANRR